jgi:hypothetical protein
MQRIFASLYISAGGRHSAFQKNIQSDATLLFGSPQSTTTPLFFNRHRLHRLHRSRNEVTKGVKRHFFYS